MFSVSEDQVWAGLTQNSLSDFRTAKYFRKLENLENLYKSPEVLRRALNMPRHLTHHSC